MSSTDQDPTSDATRRKFDDVASLFGPIVPAAGSPVRARLPSRSLALPQASDSELDSDEGPHLAPPPPLRAPPALPLRPSSPAEPFKPLTTELFKPLTAEPFKPITTEPFKPLTAEPFKPITTEPSGSLGAAPVGAPAVEPLAKGVKITPAVPLAPPMARPEKAARKAGKVPWPDGFEPRPNYKVTEKSNWLYWAFLIPFAAVVAVAITFVDPRSIRGFFDHTLPQYLPAEITQFFARPAPGPAKPELLPPGMPPATEMPLDGTTTPPAPAAAAPAAPAPEPPAATPSLSVAPAAVVPDATPAAPAAPAAEPQAPAAPTGTAVPADAPPPAAASPVQAAPDPGAPIAAPTMPVPTGPVPTGPVPIVPVPQAAAPAAEAPAPAAATPPIAAPTPAASAAAAPRVTIYYRRGQSGAESDARRVASKIGNAEIKPSSTTSRSPMIYYFHPSDRGAATTIARTLAAEGSPGWIVRAGPTRHETGKIDILLP